MVEKGKKRGGEVVVVVVVIVLFSVQSSQTYTTKSNEYCELKLQPDGARNSVASKQAGSTSIING